MSFNVNGKEVQLQGIKRSPIEGMQKNKIVKAVYKRNQGVFLQLTAAPRWIQTSQSLLPTDSERQRELAMLLESYKDIFVKPTQLPPQCRHDHNIPLLPTATPVMSRPYRYPPFQNQKLRGK